MESIPERQWGSLLLSGGAAFSSAPAGQQEAGASGWRRRGGPREAELTLPWGLELDAEATPAMLATRGPWS